MKQVVRFSAGLMFFLSFVGCIYAKFDPAEYSRDIRDFAVDVLIGDERQTRKLPDQFAVYIHSSDSSFERRAISKLDEIARISGVRMYRTVSPFRAHLAIIADEEDKMNDEAEKISPDPEFRSRWGFNRKDAFSSAKWDGAYCYTRLAVCGINLSRLTDVNDQMGRLQSTILWSMGLQGRTDEIDESSRFERYQGYTILQPADKKLLRFLYQFVPAGMNKSELKNRVEKQWENIKEKQSNVGFFDNTGVSGVNWAFDPSVIVKEGEFDLNDLEKFDERGIDKINKLSGKWYLVDGVFFVELNELEFDFLLDGPQEHELYGMNVTITFNRDQFAHMGGGCYNAQLDLSKKISRKQNIRIADAGFVPGMSAIKVEYGEPMRLVQPSDIEKVLRSATIRFDVSYGIGESGSSRSYGGVPLVN